jgi:hypothetical protein
MRRRTRQTLGPRRQRSWYQEIDVILEFFFRWAHARHAFQNLDSISKETVGDLTLRQRSDEDD